MFSRFAFALLTIPAFAQTAKLQPVQVKTEDVTYKGKACVRVSDASPAERPSGGIAAIEGSDFENGTIDLDVTGALLPNADATARGFTGLAFRIAKDLSGFECFYLRPLNGRAEDQEQRNHSVQYISPPDFPWQLLRKETPGKYETYTDLVPGEWTHMKIEVQGNKARLYVNGATQPTLIVNDLKRPQSHGAVAYWVGPGTLAHFANLKIAKE